MHPNDFQIWRILAKHYKIKYGIYSFDCVLFCCIQMLQKEIYIELTKANSKDFLFFVQTIIISYFLMFRKDTRYFTLKKEANGKERRL